MAKGGGKKRTYVRDGNGRFASTPGGGKSAALKGGTLSKRSSLKSSRAKLKAKDAADPSIRNALSIRSQKGAVTRGSKALKAAKVASQRTAVGRSKAGTISKAKRSPVLKTTVLKPEARVPASQRPGSITNTLRATMGALAKADARRIREIEAITGQKVKPTAAGVKAGKEAGARVRATAKKGKVADTLRAGLRELAQSDARTAREMAAIVRDATPKVAGAKGAKAMRGGRAALPAERSAKALTPASPARRQRTTVVPALEGSKKLAPLSPQRRKVANRAGARNSSLNELAIKAKEELKKAQNKAITANNPYSDMTPKARKTALARLKKAEEADARIRKSQMTTVRAKSFAEGFAGATKQGYTRYDNAVRRSDIRAARAKPALKPIARTKGSKTTLPRLTGTVAKPKGLKPSPVNKAAAKPMKAAVQFRSRKRSAATQRYRSNELGKKIAASIGFNQATSQRKTFANSAKRIVFKRGNMRQFNLFGGVQKVGGGKFRPIGERRSSGRIVRPKRY
jgi:hypothetical protein